MAEVNVVEILWLSFGMRGRMRIPVCVILVVF